MNTALNTDGVNIELTVEGISRDALAALAALARYAALSYLGVSAVLFVARLAVGV